MIREVEHHQHGGYSGEFAAEFDTTVLRGVYIGYKIKRRGPRTDPCSRNSKNKLE